MTPSPLEVCVENGIRGVYSIQGRVRQIPLQSRFREKNDSNFWTGWEFIRPDFPQILPFSKFDQPRRALHFSSVKPVALKWDRHLNGRFS